MKPGSILDRYIFRELIPPFLIALFFFTFVFMITKLLEVMNLFVNYQAKLSVIIKVLVLSMPFFMGYAIPMSVMMGVLLAFLRMSSDNEIMAIKAGGGSYYRLLPPVLVFCILGAVLTSFMTIWAMPYGRTTADKMVFDNASASIERLIVPRVFNDQIENTMIYVNHMDLKTKILEDVFVQDKRILGTSQAKKDSATVEKSGMTTTIIAPRGKVISEKGGAATRLRLYDGTIYTIDSDEESGHIVFFDTYDVVFDLMKLKEGAGTPTHREAMTIQQLRAFIEKTNVTVAELEKKGFVAEAKYYRGTVQNAKMEIYRRIAMPFSCIVLGSLAVPLGMYSVRSRRSFGLVIGLGCFVLYYLLTTAGWTFGESGSYPPFLAMWMPNIVVALIAVYLFRRLVQERVVDFDWLYPVERWWQNLRRAKS